MKREYLLVCLFLISCGKPKNDGDFPSDRILPRIIVTEIPHHHAESVKSNCYFADASMNLSPAYQLHGTFYQGTIYVCAGSLKSCMGHGVYVHYYLKDQSCITKKGFEEQFNLCMRGKNPDQRSSTEGTLVRLDLTKENGLSDLWCDEKVLQIMVDDLDLS